MNQDGRYDVVWPLGRAVRETVAEASRPSSLAGKTIAFIWDYLFKGPEMFSIIQESLAQKWPDIRFVDYEVFGDIHCSDPELTVNLNALPSLLSKHHVDAAVIGVGA
jgi:hypothetical protein